MSSSADSTGVIVLYNVSDKLVVGEARDLPAEQDVITYAKAVVTALQEAGYSVVELPFHGDVETALAPYPAADWIIFNLAEGVEGKLFEEARIAWALEAMGYRFTGNTGDALATSTHKVRAKKRLTAAGIPTPTGWLFRPGEGVHPPPDLPFPLIVKPVAEDASLGIGPNAVVRDVEALRRQVAYITSQYRQAALAERFIVGRELNLALWGEPPEILPIAEIDFSAFRDPLQQFVSFSAKWESDSFEYRHTPVRCPAELDQPTRRWLEEIGHRAWRAIGCRGYARVDVRMSPDGVPYVVEVNCNPDLAPEAGFFRSAKAAGFTYAQMINRILAMAWP